MAASEVGRSTPTGGLLAAISDPRWVSRLVRMRHPRLDPETREEIEAELVVEVLSRLSRQPRLEALVPEAVCSMALREVWRRTSRARRDPGSATPVGLTDSHAAPAAEVSTPIDPTRGLRPSMDVARATSICAYCGGRFRGRRAARYCQRPECARRRRNEQWTAAVRRRRAQSGATV